MREASGESKWLYSRPEAAAALGFSLRSLDRLAAINELHVRRIGRRVFVTRESLQQFIKRDHRTGGTPGGAK
jgi:hypothetical protein